MDYDKAIELYSPAIDLNCSCSTDTMFKKRCAMCISRSVTQDRCGNP
ncbi:hypothetical protein AZE42_11525 [Rhizopogon vesiculosus]|uniref:Uncharacterized protein n=1 Tax=Rhizopogon vesiculosus TaxID=180088 RepID=A0A1J8PH11_9AGAM|nr:hypothetical protein AZE42_11525 [Rhizopogon vesiculosus]